VAHALSRVQAPSARRVEPLGDAEHTYRSL